MNLIGSLICITLLAMIVIACVKTAYGLAIFTLGVILLFFSYLLDFIVWSSRTTAKLWKIVFP